MVRGNILSWLMFPATLYFGLVSGNVLLQNPKNIFNFVTAIVFAYLFIINIELIREKRE